MNFAERLIDWRDNQEKLQKCQEEINYQINAKATFIVEKLQRDTKNGEIGVYVLNTTELYDTLSTTAYYKYEKAFPNSIFLQLLSNAFSSKENIVPIIDTIVTENITMNKFYIFYYTEGNAVDKLVEAWFNSYVLKDFERKYKIANRETARFTNFYEEKYTYSPLIKFMNRCLISYKLDAIKEQIQKLANDNGLYASLDVYPEFSLQIR